MTTTTDERFSHVACMRTNFAMEGLLPDATDLALQTGYIDGDLTLNDMLSYGRAFAKSMALSERQVASRVPSKL